MSGAPLTFRRAVAGDVPALVALLADDVLGAQREQLSAGGLARYSAAFGQIDADPNQFLCVVERAGQIAGTLQLSFLAGLSRGGALRGQIEAVRVAAGMRGQGIGKAMVDWAIEECRARGCGLVQLTTDRSRTEAHAFYEALGFAASHVGYKLQL
ncbi:GNAT family N-acetyltransferase [Frigidibacter mobilis]|uniref:Putative acetyltransferase n=1 Tax=Frigidibacter mobilis TaxID=1335048 RepID=A0A159YYS1_9RHOB|nr:GNAT family N-acetyltransferase [Frigidibacter mobilis]AMY67595.1 putative acetyltransferase [Frigidibacter mobilis]